MSGLPDLTHLPRPGGPAARTLGCDCPVLDSDGGYTLTERLVRFPAIDGKTYVTADDCPMHGLQPAADHERTRRRMADLEVQFVDQDRDA